MATPSRGDLTDNLKHLQEEAFTAYNAARSLETDFDLVKDAIERALRALQRGDAEDESRQHQIADDILLVPSTEKPSIKTAFYTLASSITQLHELLSKSFQDAEKSSTAQELVKGLMNDRAMLQTLITQVLEDLRDNNKSTGYSKAAGKCHDAKPIIRRISEKISGVQDLIRKSR